MYSWWKSWLCCSIWRGKTFVFKVAVRFAYVHTITCQHNRIINSNVQTILEVLNHAFVLLIYGDTFALWADWCLLKYYADCCKWWLLEGFVVMERIMKLFCIARGNPKHLFVIVFTYHLSFRILDFRLIDRRCLRKQAVYKPNFFQTAFTSLVL